MEFSRVLFRSDPIDESDAIPPAIDALRRRLMLAGLIEKHNPPDEEPIAGAAAFQLAEGLGRVIDQLHYEEVAPARLADIESALGDLAGHWQASWRRLSLPFDASIGRGSCRERVGQ